VEYSVKVGAARDQQADRREVHHRVSPGWEHGAHIQWQLYVHARPSLQQPGQIGGFHQHCCRCPGLDDGAQQQLCKRFF